MNTHININRYCQNSLNMSAKMYPNFCLASKDIENEKKGDMKRERLKLRGKGWERNWNKANTDIFIESKKVR